jgi:tetrapyrrole methylase family protein/MazG family protein
VPAGAYEHLEEELGDHACQVVLHYTFAREAGAFTVTDVLSGIHAKLVRRHPHVFGDVAVSGAADVVANWEVIKREEKGRTSLMDGVSRHLPSLLYAHKLYRKAESAGLRFGTSEEALDRAGVALRDLAAGAGGDAADGASDGHSAADAERRLGEALATVVYLARLAGIDGESALRGWAGRFRERFQRLEALAAERGAKVESFPPEQVAALWEQVS